MQFTQKLIEDILARKKTQTRRLVKPGDAWEQTGHRFDAVIRNGRTLWRVGQTYAVCPGRGKPQVARFRLLRIRREDVRDISQGDAIAEGFENELGFWETWCGFYDPKGWEILAKPFLGHWSVFKHRPDELYRAWALTFELVEQEKRTG